MNVLIKNGRVIDPSSGFDDIADLYIKDQQIIARLSSQNDSASNIPPASFVADTTIDASEQWILPGIVDLAATLREPGQEQKATIHTETRAAAHAGITHLCYMPEPNSPIDSMATVNLIRKRAEASPYAHVDIIGALTVGLNGKQLSNMGGLKAAHCIGVSNNRSALADTRILRLAMDYANSFDLTLFLHPIDHALQGSGCANEGEVSTRMGLRGIPVAAETSSMATIFSLIEQTGARVHLCRLSSARSVRMLRMAREQGLNVTADVAAHQLFLTEFDVSDFNPLCHVQPPLRTEQDKECLRQGIADGTINAICSDHQPHDIDAKLAPFQLTEPGISSLETLLPLTLRLVEEGVTTLEQAIKSISSHPAAILGNSKIGGLDIGQQADMIIYNPNDLFELTKESLRSQGKNTPFIGWNFSGRIVDTLIGGVSVNTISEME